MSDINFKQFHFLNFTTFLRLDILSPFVKIAQSYADIDPIPDGSIELMIPTGEMDRFNKSKDSGEILSMMLQSNTKVLDALAYVQARNNEGYQVLFTKTETSEVKMEYQTQAVKLAMSAIMIFVTRGALPAMNSRSAETRLPDFVKNIIDDKGISKERDLKEAIMSYDPKHLNMSKFFESDALNNWDPIVCNRLILGVAGHKPLKVVIEAQRYLVAITENDQDPSHQFVRVLLDKATNAQNGFYPNLHPSKQIVSTQFKDFYKQSLLAIYNSILGAQQEKLTIFKRIRALSPDKWVQEDKFLTHPVTYNTWDFSSLDTAFGDPVSFTPIDREKILTTIKDSERPVSYVPKHQPISMVPSIQLTSASPAPSSDKSSVALTSSSKKSEGLPFTVDE